MKSVIHATLIAAGALLAGAAGAVDITPPVAGPTPTGVSGNGGLILAAWTDAKSVVTYLGTGFTSVEFADLTVNPTSLDFGTISGLISNFGVDLATAGVQYAVFAADTNAVGGTGFGLSTTVANPGVILDSANGGFNDIFGSQYQASAGAVDLYVTDIMNNSAGCNNALPCVQTNVQTGYFTAFANNGTNLGGLNFDISTTAGTGLEMWNFLTIGDSGESVFTGYTANGYTGQWLLSSTGQLTYEFGNPVPLPAAAWLLLSGIAGLGAVARRRRETV